MQLLCLIPILILLLYLLVSTDLVYTGNCELDIRNCSGEEQLFAKLYNNHNKFVSSSAQIQQFRELIID